MRRRICPIEVSETRPFFNSFVLRIGARKNGRNHFRRIKFGDSQSSRQRQFAAVTVAMSVALMSLIPIGGAVST